MKWSNYVRLNIILEGRVQGVGFRYFVQEKAMSMKVVGFVRNTPDSRVEVVAEGEHDVLDRFLEAVAHGPAMGFVTKTTHTLETATHEFATFDVRSK